MNRMNYPQPLRNPTSRSYPSMPRVSSVRQIQLWGNGFIRGSWSRGNYSKKSSRVTEVTGIVTTGGKSQKINFDLIVQKFGTKSGHKNV